MITWKPLEVSPEEEAKAKEIIAAGAGAVLSEEKLNEYSVPYEQSFAIDTEAGPCTVHYYRPIEGDDLLPLFIDIHGGGFIKGRRDQDIVFCRNISSRSGWAVLDIDYVPAPVMRFPGQVYACYDAVQYCFAHSQELRIDPACICVGGHSAGGSLTAALNLMAIDRGGHLPAAQVLDYPGLDVATPASEKRNGNSNPRIPAEKSTFYDKMYANAEDRTNPYCSPAYATDAQLSQMPPTLMMYCENDTFCDEDAAFHHRLLALGVPVCGKRFLHSDHGFLVQRKGEYAVGEDLLLRFLKELAGPKV